MNPRGEDIWHEGICDWALLTKMKLFLRMRKTREAYVENVEQYEIHKGGKSMEHMLPKAIHLIVSHFCHLGFSLH